MKTTMIITLSNHFHNTVARILVPEAGARTVGAEITKSQYNRAAKKLCGMADCRCTTISAITDEKGQKYWIEPSYDGSYMLYPVR